MKKHYILLYCFICCLLPTAWSQSASAEFVENQGQWGDWIRYKAKTIAGEMDLERDGFRYILADPTNTERLDSFEHGHLQKNPLLKFHVYKMTMQGANKNTAIRGVNQQKTYYNYFQGNDPKRWKGGIHPYLGLEYSEVYPNIDMHVGSEGTALVYEFFVKPGGDADKIQLRFDGPDKISVNKKGDLVIKTSVGMVHEAKPYVYQYEGPGDKRQIACNYRLEDNVLSFEFPEGYNRNKMLIIDPVTYWASFTGSTADNWGFTATYDNTGHLYMGGIVNCLAGAGGGTYPVSPGAYQTTWGGGQGTGIGGIQFAADIGIMKLSPDGVSRIYATYIGGANNDRPHSMIVDANGDLIVAGRALSPNYPVSAGAYQPARSGGWDVVVSKLNASGTALLASTFVGGTGDDGVNFDSTTVGFGNLKFNYGDDARSEVLVDNGGNIYVASSTSSTNFPVTPTAISSTLSGTQDGVVFKLNPNMTSLLWSTYLSGTLDDAGYVLGFNPSQTSVYVGGGTSSSNFPVGPGGWQTTYQGDLADGYILKFRNSPPYNLQRGTFVGTSNYDQVYGIQVDHSGNVYCMGQSMGGAFPTTAGVYTNPSSCQFIMKMDSNLSTDLISTVYGSGDPLHTNISPVAFLVDTCENVYVSGWGGNLLGIPGLAHSGTTTGMPTFAPTGETPIQTTTDGFDFYFIVLGPNMTSLRYATFYGRVATGGLGEHVDGGTSRFDKAGVIYQGICANCGGTAGPPFPTTPGVWAPTSMSGNCNQAGLKIAFNIGPVDVNITAGPSTSGCAPLTVNFFNATTNGLSFLWNFGDGSPTTTTYAPTHTFTSAGTFTVTLTSTNANACFKTEDTAFIIIHVDTNKITPDFSYTVTDSCGPYIATFTNTSTTNITTGTPTYSWHFGDGGTFAGEAPPAHTYADTGWYEVILVMSHPDACKSPDTVRKWIHLHYEVVSATFSMPDSICLGARVNFTGAGKNATTININYGDGSSSNVLPPPAHIYTAIGTYTVTLVAENLAACNKGDTEVRYITVLPTPIANFSFAPIKPEANIPTKFTNKSISATRYEWNFGDDTKSNEEHPTHQYNKTGQYKVCLTAYNNSNCPSVMCKDVPSEVLPLIGLPTGFSPNGDGQNDILYVRGAAIKTMNLKIYNRWGQLVFESNSMDVGWDGTFGGQPQPMEAYGYVLDATFIDETTRSMKGNITLIR